MDILLSQAFNYFFVRCNDQLCSTFRKKKKKIDYKKEEEMIQKIIDWMNENKVSVAFVGAALVITTQWFTCSVEPTSSTPEPQQVEGEE